VPLRRRRLSQRLRQHSQVVRGRADHRGRAADVDHLIGVRQQLVVELPAQVERPGCTAMSASNASADSARHRNRARCRPGSLERRIAAATSGWPSARATIARISVRTRPGR
jgi:hypothetical protein